jgi:hypothetical protein
MDGGRSAISDIRKPVSVAPLGAYIKPLRLCGVAKAVPFPRQVWTVFTEPDG